MVELISAPIKAAVRSNARHRLLARLIKNRWLYLMAIPGMLYFIVFKYLPMWGLLIAFQNYQPTLGMLHSKWVGFQHFERFFFDSSFVMLFKNTLILAFYNLVFFFPLPIIMALLLNEVRKEVFKRTIQTIVYIPHFVSWVVVVGISYIFFTTEGGIVNDAFAALGLPKVEFLISSEWFRTMIVSQVVWKETGWGTIIFLAALAGVDQQLYEAATIDGAGRFRQVWHITLPAIRSVIVILFILRLGSFLDTGFEQIFLMLNAMNRDVGEVFDTYVYNVGIQQGQFSYSTAVGLFKSLIGLMLVMGANRMAKKFGENGLY
ncbi:putative aldouronate transport system permease protein [Paenibacillus sp. V4I3]|uniref:ABC transporter permease n=1 Tax=unclassified Paenibacillus TaxID=185978 RepID=UPI00277E18C1|nr:MULTISPECIES: sugar ABC transporter permease [unclassified Paenibacillus]MDQ0877245.1 putative aldouronate transport system permease protein [Paenibacillus sp. V4I3]MDQ0886876.1 putative aldouronate transport system permease protein [Paenibacillus sp. V4I9]